VDLIVKGKAYFRMGLALSADTGALPSTLHSVYHIRSCGATAKKESTISQILGLALTGPYFLNFASFAMDRRFPVRVPDSTVGWYNEWVSGIYPPQGRMQQMKLALDTMDGLKVADQKGRITLGSKYAGKHYAVREGEDGTTTLIPVLIVPEREQPLTAERFRQRFAALETLRDDWDGHGSPAPSNAVLTEAREAAALLHAGAVVRGVRWEEPHVGVNERGQITLEWWKGERSLTVFVRAEDRMDYLKAWGTDIEAEMEDGELSRLSDFAALCRWLYEEGTREA
jgi:hypothetical protein